MAAVMYSVRCGDAWLHDPPTGRVLASVRLSATANDVSTCEMVMPRDHPEAPTLRVRDMSRPITVWDGRRCLFEGYVWEVRETMAGDLEVACRGGLAWLADTIVPPYTTDEDNEGVLRAPNRPADLLRWYVDRHNERVQPRQRFEVGANEGNALDANAYIRRESSQRPSTLSEIVGKLIDPLGGVLTATWDGTVRRLDWHAECSGATTQVIDFGAGLTDYLRTDTADGMATALVPVGGTPEGEDGPVTLDGMPEGEVSPGVTHSGGVVWSARAVAEHGWVASTFQSEALTQEGLLESAAKALGAGLEPVTTIEADAVDLSLLGMAEPLAVGEYARVRSDPHGVDEYLLVTAMDLDLTDPSKSRYALGAPRGGYTERLRRLNASINRHADEVAALSDDVRAAAVDAEEALRTATDVPIVTLASTNGTVFKRNLGVSTTIVATVYTPGGTISTASELAERFGAAAYLEWGWRDVATDAPHVLLTDDPRISMGGFALTVTPDDIDVQATITCSLNY